MNAQPYKCNNIWFLKRISKTKICKQMATVCLKIGRGGGKGGLKVPPGLYSTPPPELRGSQKGVPDGRAWSIYVEQRALPESLEKGTATNSFTLQLGGSEGIRSQKPRVRPKILGFLKGRGSPWVPL